MLLDVETISTQPKRRNEYHRILNALNKTQANVSPTSNVITQRLKVEESIVGLTRENMKLAVEEYKAKSDFIVNEINKLVQSKIKYIPQASKILNYVRPQMNKRRLSEQVLPTVTNAVNDLIANLNSRHSPPAEVTKMNHQLPASTSHNVQTKSCVTNDIEMDKSLLENRKRKNHTNCESNSIRGDNTKKRSIFISKISRSTSSIPNICSSLESVAHVDLDSTDMTLQPELFEIPNNVVKTVAEAYTNYKSFSPAQQVLPVICNPPDTPIMSAISINQTTKTEKKFIQICLNAIHPSSEAYSLVTFHSQSSSTFPKSNLAINVSPCHFITSRQNIIPRNCPFVYEVLLFDETAFNDFKRSLTSFVSWAESREAPYFFTVPDSLSKELSECLPDVNLVEFSRPFLQEASVYLTT
jgi:hypothetical protein